MRQEERPALYEIVVDKYRKGQVSIDVNKGSALIVYARYSRNPLIKLFNYAIRVYSFPLTIVGVIFASVFLDCYLYILYYLIGLFGLIALEDYLSRAATIHSAMYNRNAFTELCRRGVISVRDAVNPDFPV
jgi:hypothetical protein